MSTCWHGFPNIRMEICFSFLSIFTELKMEDESNENNNNDTKKENNDEIDLDDIDDDEIDQVYLQYYKSNFKEGCLARLS